MIEVRGTYHRILFKYRLNFSTKSLSLIHQLKMTSVTRIIQHSKEASKNKRHPRVCQKRHTLYPLWGRDPVRGEPRQVDFPQTICDGRGHVVREPKEEVDRYEFPNVLSSLITHLDRDSVHFEGFFEQVLGVLVQIVEVEALAVFAGELEHLP